MKIAILSSAPNGGAGIAAYRVYEALQAEQGNDVDFFDLHVLGAVEESVSPNISATNRKISNTHFTVDFATEKRQWVVDLLSEYDIVNIHWSSWLISLSEVLALADMGRKILFTLHDFYYITGGCHYPAGCFGYLNSCIFCPQVDERLCEQLTVVDTLKIKRRIFSNSNVYLAAPSAFIAESAIQSGIVPRERAYVLRNAYTAISGINVAKCTNIHSLLLISDSFSEVRKGLELAVDAIKITAESMAASGKEFQLHLVGGLDVEVAELLNGTSVRVISHGHIKQHGKLVEIFKQCQFMLSCSYEDNWPNILVESASYGCLPIVGRWHGCEEFVNTFSRGYVANNYSPESFANAIERAFSLSSDDGWQQAMSLADEVRRVHSYTCAAENYMNLFNIMMDSLELNGVLGASINDELFSVNHLLVNVRLKYDREKANSMNFQFNIIRKPSPFGNANKTDSGQLAIDGTEKINDLLAEVISPGGYGLASYYIQVEKG